jgi:hypothetical protein
MMRLFALRFMLTHPDILPPEDFPERLLKDAKVDEFAKLGRADFLKEVLPRLFDRGSPTINRISSLRALRVPLQFFS